MIINIKVIKEILNNSLYILLNLNININEIFLVLITFNNLNLIYDYENEYLKYNLFFSPELLKNIKDKKLYINFNK